MLRAIRGLHLPPCVLHWDRPCLSLFLSVWTRVSASVKHRRLAPPPLHFHNIRYNVTVCCGLRTLITRQENNVDGKAGQHHLRSLNPRGPAGWLSGFTWLTRSVVWGMLNKLAAFKTGSLVRQSFTFSDIFFLQAVCLEIHEKVEKE